jgi:hypothetical protein
VNVSEADPNKHGLKKGEDGIYTWHGESGDVDVSGCCRMICEEKVSFPGLRFFQLFYETQCDFLVSCTQLRCQNCVEIKPLFTETLASSCPRIRMCETATDSKSSEVYVLPVHRVVVGVEWLPRFLQLGVLLFK